MTSHAFRQASFLTSANRLGQLPPDRGAEVAFAGRSNAGKSSALNSICDQQGLARTSRTPGRTQMLNVFVLDPARRLIDLPGYGYAKVPAAMRDHWRGVIDTYLRTRVSLKGLVLVMDARHPLREFDRDMLAFGAASGRRCHCLLTKADKLSRSEGMRTLAAVRQALAAEFPDASAQLFSSSSKSGVAEARSLLTQWLFADAADATGNGPDASD
ncbi:ribosome biogenesis GTP-binding protein YihA/YsxC [Dokdonella sp.]|uniref:ribosome biogenesis GTP-binding protein YihA/YsxC n=1 Tax=Dokdonella sp. TaxID=2291710 RepID=UPI0031BD051F|nr:ribosome biogenesis GTP-binding protein YihA/YsxC [Dokdonella sp.]